MDVEGEKITSPGSGSDNKPFLQEEDEISSTNETLTANDKMYVYIIAGVAALNNCNLGYDIGIVTNVGPLLLAQTQFECNEYQLELWVGCLDLASLIGAFTSNYLADWFGRKGCMSISAVLFIFSVLGMAFSPNYAVLMVCRFMTGVGVGFGLAIGPLYIGEISPSECRGTLIAWSELATNVGLLLGFGAGYVFDGIPANLGWRVMLGLGAVMPIILLMCLAFVPESPRWFVMNNRFEEAEEVLRDIYDEGADVRQLVMDIRMALEDEREQEGKNGGGWNGILHPKPIIKTALIAGIGMSCIQQLSGIEALTSYFMFLLEEAGVKARQNMFLLGFGFCKLITVWFASKLFDNPAYGRKKLLYTSGFGVFLAMLMFLWVFSTDSPHRGAVAVVATFWYVIAYSIGYGPGTWIVCAEVFPMQIRAKGISVTTFVNRLVATILSGSFLTLVDVLSYQGFFIIFTFITFFCVVFIHFFVPEMQGMNLEDVFAMLDEEGRSRAGSVRSRAESRASTQVREERRESIERSMTINALHPSKEGNGGNKIEEDNSAYGTYRLVGDVGAEVEAGGQED